MKAAPLAYARATSLDHAFALWKEGGEDARLIAGGQSLVASLNLRLSDIPALIDINHIAELSGIRDDGETVRIGALTRHRDLIASPVIAEHAPLLAEAAHQIAHYAVRTRGTIGGSLAYADPAAELPACILALEATLVVASENGAQRRIAAQDFFLGLFETSLAPFEMIVAVEVPKMPSGGRQKLLELTRRTGDYAIVGIAATARSVEPVFVSPRIVFFGVGDAAILAVNVNDALSAGASAIELLKALESDIEPTSDMNGSAAFKQHLAGVLLKRVVAALRQSGDPVE